MKQFACLLLILGLCLQTQAANEQRITVNSTSVQEGMVSVAATGPNGKVISLMCFDRGASCAVPMRGAYFMRPAGEEGQYEDCTNVVLYSSSNSRVGVYCWENSGDCYIFTCSAEKIEVVPSTAAEVPLTGQPASGGAVRTGAGNSLPDIFVSVLAEVKAKTSVPVLLPTELPRPFRNAKNSTVEKAAPDEYAVVLWYELGAGDAGYAASFSGKNNPPFSPRELGNISEVKLTRGIVGFFRAVSCGGSCAPANLWWQRGASLYNIQLKLGSTLGEKKQQKIITEVANSAIQAGPR